MVAIKSFCLAVAVMVATGAVRAAPPSGQTCTILVAQPSDGGAPTIWSDAPEGSVCCQGQGNQPNYLKLKSQQTSGEECYAQRGQ